MNLKEIGYSDKLQQLRNENNLSDFEIGRVIAEHKERYIVKTEKGEYEAEITGNLRFSAKCSTLLKTKRAKFCQRK
jgi:ribosome biogenesis GTPase